MSSYTGELTQEVVNVCMAKIKVAFPTLDKPYFMMLFKMAKENGFTDQRLKDVVQHVIETCIYPQPTIAQFLSYDQEIKLYSRSQLLTMNGNGNRPFDIYKAVDIGKDVPMYATEEDIIKYKLKRWEEITPKKGK